MPTDINDYIFQLNIINYVYPKFKGAKIKMKHILIKTKTLFAYKNTFINQYRMG